jgi:hypothetical protein
MNSLIRTIVSTALLSVPLFGFAWQLSPEGSFIEKKLANRTQGFVDKFMSSMALRGIHIFGNNVHEEVTNRTLGCQGDGDVCSSPEFDPDYAYFLTGVRWNDDPPFRFTSSNGNFSGCVPSQTVRLITQPLCWANTFKDGEKRAAVGKKLDGSNATLLIRSHFGDFQFLHSMASADDESPFDTKKKILAWAEFTWGVGIGIYELDTPVSSLKLEGFDKLFVNNREWRIQDLFALGNPHIRSKEAMSKVAFGSLLHTVQDSFAGGHVERREPAINRTCNGNPQWAQPGQILEFHSYSKQDSTSHADSDRRNAFSAHWSGVRPNVVDVGSELFRMHNRKAAWLEVLPYLDCIYTLDSLARNASAGERYVKN